MSESGDSSRHSFSTGGASSAASETSDAQALNALQERAGGDGEDNNDLVSGNRGVSEAIFATLVLLGKSRGQQDLRWIALRVVLEFLQMFRVVFNTSFLWVVRAESPAFQAIRWVLFRFLVLPKGYNTYIVVFYIIAATIFLSLILTAYVAVVLKKDDSTAGGWLSRLVQFMQLLAMVMYSVAWVSILDFLVFMFDCQWNHVAVPSSVSHIYFQRSCMAMPHLAHMAFAVVVTLVFMLTCLGLSVGDCDLNPLTRNMLGTPAAVTNLVTLALKMVMVVLSTAAGGANPKLQSIVMALCSGYITYLMVMAAAYYNAWVNHVWNGLWTGIVYTTILLNVIVFKYSTDKAVLYGIFGAVLVGAGLSAARLWWLRRPLADLAAAKDDPESQRNLAKVYRFRNPGQVEILARVMRKWDDDGVPDEEAGALGEFIIKCGMARFPNDATLMITLANFQIEARKDGQGARTQLGLAIKASPSTIQRFFIYKTQDLAKKLKDESGGLDLMGYIEFQRNYRACVRSHRVALQAQRVFWQVLLHDTVAFKSLQDSFHVMNTAEKQATQIYRRVLDRYPANGRLLKIYGRFLEWVRNEPSVAQKYYVEAMKQGMGESLLGLIGGTGSSDQEGALKTLGTVDEKVDGVIIINAVGMIMAVNKAAYEKFQYLKGELESKNVSCLMPQPFSGRHNGYLSHYVNTGEPRILNVNQAVVGITKNHTIFPVDLTVVKLSGTGQDSVFMGVLHCAEESDPSVVRLWVTPGSGIILCADERFADNFGVSHADVAGRPFSTLGPDMEALNRLIEQATNTPPKDRIPGAVTLETKLLHRRGPRRRALPAAAAYTRHPAPEPGPAPAPPLFLPPVGVKVSVTFAGTVCETILVLNIQAATLAGAMMAVDNKGRIVYATTQLGVMLGYSARQVAAMELSAIIPPPYSQMHAGFMKELGNTPPTTSCRAGAVVHLLRSNGVKVPVTLQLATHDDGERVQHVVRVTPSSDTVQMDRLRLVLALDEAGHIRGGLVGKSVSSCVNVFGEWAQRHGEEGSLLMALGVRAMEGADESWRVGITAQGAGGEDAREAAGGSSLLAALQQRSRVRPALLQAEVVVRGSGGEGGDDMLGLATRSSAALAASGGGEEVQLHLVLWRADALTAVIELDRNLSVVRADAAAGLLFGISSKLLLKKDFRRLAGLPKTATASDLMTAGTGGPKAGKKSGLKAGAAAKVGVVKTLTTMHADGGRLVLAAQCVSKQSHGGQHLVMRLSLAEPSTGSVEPLLALKAGGRASGTGAAMPSANRLLGGGNDSGDEEGGGEEGERARGERPPPGRSGKLGGGGAVSKGARRGAALEAGGEEDEDGGSDGGDSDGGKGGRGKRGKDDPRRRIAAWVDGGAKAHADDDEGDSGEEGPRGANRWGGDGRGGGGGGDGDSASEASSGGRGRPPGRSGPGEIGAAPGGFGPGGFGPGVSMMGGPGAASVGDASASQVSGSEGDGGASSAAGDGHGDDELNADFRRAKRLKKLNRMMTSSAAQSSTLRFKRQTWFIIGIILAAHVMGYAILSTQIKLRFENMHDTAKMARATDRFQLSAMRINFLQKCAIPQYSGYEICSSDQMENMRDRLMNNLHLLTEWHQSLYLGQGSLNTFADKRLYDRWTHTKVEEKVWMMKSLEGGGEQTTHNATLWEMGNKYIASGHDVHYAAPSLGAALENSTFYRYMYLNGPGAIFEGYAWSLDTQVDFSWVQLGTLSTVLIVLLIVLCMVYQFFLVRSANAQHMRRFSVFLALPSATVRIMASRQIVVEDDGNEEGDDDDEMEMAGAATQGGATVAASTAGGAGGDAKAAPKSVRMADGGDDDEEADGAKAKAKGSKSGAKKARSSAAAVAADKKKPPKTLARRIYKALFGWMDTVIKLNGKKLSPNNVVVLKMMLPLVLWAAAVVVIFGVTFQKLAGLQAPLASLNAAARVTYLISRVRLLGNYLAFSDHGREHRLVQEEVLAEIGMLRETYAALMYGGELAQIAKVSYDPHTPPAAFASEPFANLFFRTKDCLREDQSTCYPEDHPWYQITHSGLDAMIEKFMDTYEAFALLPPELAYADHPLYVWIAGVGGHDMVEGIYQAVTMFEEYTIAQFESVTQLHQIMLVVTIFLVLGFMVLLYRPYVRLLHEESKDIAGMLSQLPAEVNVEDTVKTHVLGLPPRGDGRSASMTAGGSSMMMIGPGGGMMGFPSGPGGGMMGPGGRLMLPGPPGFHPSGAGGLYGGADGAVAVNIGGRGPGSGWGGGQQGYY
ncbi:MAG: hypothetical protein J3K34DRAFT_523567 [Monoraphidium minutum]|nr:MAG: hypothetical protein J3K34DRAFT_523567 [Monoraphidium minutum]